MAEKVEGFTITIDAETIKFDESLTGIKKSISLLNNELKNTNKQLRLDPKNVDLLSKKMDLLKQKEEATKKKLEEFKKKLDEMDESDVGSDEWIKLQKQISNTESELQKVKSEIDETDSKISKLGKNGAIAKLNANFDQTAEKIGKIGKKATLLSVAIGGAFAKGIEGASDLSENLNKTQVAFGKYSKKVEEFSETSIDQFGISQNMALETASLYGDMGTAMGLTKEEASDMAISLTGLSGDLASFKNISQDQAMNALKGIFTGETESLKSLGIVMNQTTLDQYALANGFGKTTKDMTEQEKVMLRYSFVMDATKNAQGDYARTSDGMANAVRTLKGHIEQLMTSFGKLVLPYIEKAIGFITEIIKKIEGLSDKTKGVIAIVLGVVSAIGPLLVGISGVMKFTSKLLPIVQKISVFAKLTQVGLLGIIGVVVGVIAILVALYVRNESIRESLQKLIENVLPILQSAWNSIVSLFQNVVIPILKAVWDIFETMIVPILTTLMDVITENVLPVIQDVFKFIETTIVPIIETIWKWISENLVPIFKRVASILGGVVSSALKFVGKMFSNLAKFIGDVIGFIGDLFGWLEDIGVIDVFKDALDGLLDVVNWLCDAFETFCGWISDAFDLLGDFFGTIGEYGAEFLEWINPFDSGGYGDLNANGGSLSLTTNINVHNNGTPINERTIRQWGNTITDIVDENLGRRR